MILAEPQLAGIGAGVLDWLRGDGMCQANPGFLRDTFGVQDDHCAALGWSRDRLEAELTGDVY